MHYHLEIHKRRLQKIEHENELEDEFLMSGKYQNHWGVLMNKGYQSAADVLRDFTARKSQFEDISHATMKSTTGILRQIVCSSKTILVAWDNCGLYAQPNLYGLKTYTTLCSD